jgi:hypothetical protein
MQFDDQKIEQILKSVTKTKVPLFNAARIRNQILTRIAIPETVKAGFFSALTPYLRLGAGITASLLIVVSLTLGTAVAALESVPGSAIYPLKKIVENIELKLTPADEKANIQLKFAGNRADELQQVLEKKQEGKITAEEAETIVANTVKDLQKTAAAAVTASKSQNKSTAIVGKLNDISNKLKAASVQSEGQVKIELEKALESTKISQEEAIKNLEQAGLKVENTPIEIENSVTASGKLTTIAQDSVSIGTAKFMITKETKYEGMKVEDLKVGVLVDIKGEIKDNKSYAIIITKISDVKPEVKAETISEEPESDTTEESQ